MKLGNFLVKAGVLKRAELDEALQHQVLHGARLGTCLVELGMLSIDTLAQQLAKFHGVPVPGRGQLEQVQPAAARRLTRTLVEKRRVLPLKLESASVLHVAMLDPHDPSTLDDLRFVARARIVPYVLPELVMHDWLEWLFQVPRRLRYVDLSHARPAPAPKPAPATTAVQRTPGPGTLRGVGSAAGLDMGRWETDGAPSAGGVAERMAFGAALAAHAEPPSAEVANDMAGALKHVVPMSEQTPSEPSVLSVPPPRDTKPPPALVLPDLSPPPVPPIVTSVTVRGARGTLPGTGGTRTSAPTPEAGTLPEPAPDVQPIRAPESAPAPVPESTSAQDENSAARSDGMAVVAWAGALEAAVFEAEDRDALVDAALRLAGLYAEVVAVFSVHRGMVQGVRALGPLGDLDGLAGVLIEEQTPAQLTAPVESGEAARFVIEADSLDAQVLQRLGREQVREGAVFPVRLRNRTVTLLYADYGAEPLPHSCFGALREVAGCMAAGYEQLIRKRRGG